MELFSLRTVGDSTRLIIYRLGVHVSTATSRIECKTLKVCLCLQDRTAVRSGAETDQLSLFGLKFRGESLGDCLLTPVCPIEKVTL